MSGHPQKLYTPARVPDRPLHLAPPLDLAWAFENSGTYPVASEDLVFARVGAGEGLVCLDGRGRELWRKQGNWNWGLALGARLLVGVVGASDWHRKYDTLALTLIEPRSGREILRAPTRFGLYALLPDGRSLLGIRTDPAADDGDRVVQTLARLALEPGLPALWRIEAGRGDDAELFDWDLAVSDGRVFVGRGQRLLALHLETGEALWSASLEALGGAHDRGKWMPMAAHGRVVIAAGSATAAFDAETGALAWSFPELGARAVYGDRLYLCRDDGRRRSYRVLDVRDGRPLSDVALDEAILADLGVAPLKLTTQIAVTETHTFVGDEAGRLYALERDTGRPVWCHHPEAGSGFSRAIPVVAGGRLLVPGFSRRPRRSPRLLCYAPS